MSPGKDASINDWLPGSTALCQSCGCLLFVPGVQTGEKHICRQCGAEVPAGQATARRGDATQAQTRSRIIY